MAIKNLNPENKRESYELLDMYEEMKSTFGIDSFYANQLLKYEQTAVLEELQVAVKLAVTPIFDRRINEINLLLN